MLLRMREIGPYRSLSLSLSLCVCVCVRVRLFVFCVVFPDTLLYWTSKNIRYIPVHMPTP